jgi:putative peptidoglycan lipid II flippase
MVKKILNILHREIQSVHYAAYFLGGFALLSQVLALFRDRMLAHTFGASQALDIYYAAFRTPDLIFNTVASLVSISVLIPFFAEKIDSKREESARFLNNIFTAFFIVMVLASVLAFFLLPLIVKILLPGVHDPAVDHQLISLSRILLLQPIFLGISNLLGSITQLYKRFLIYALSPILYNVAIIFGIVFLYPFFGLYGIAAGVVIGAILHFSIQLPYISSIGLVPKFVTRLNMADIKRVLFLSLPRTLTLSANSLEIIFITSYASFMATGSIAIYNLSLNLQSVPFAIIGVSYSLAAFPTLSKLYSGGEKEKFMDHLKVASRHIIFWSLPVTTLFIVLRAQIVRVILGSGNFSWSDTRLTAACLALFTVSLLAQGIELLFIRGYYATGNTKKPLIINLISSFLTITLPFVFIQIFNHVPTFQYFIEDLFRVDGIKGTSVLMLPLGYSLGTIINAVVFWICFEIDFKQFHFSRSLLRTLWQSFATSVLVGYISYVALSFMGKSFNLNTASGIFFQGFFAGIIGILCGIGILKLLKSVELEEIFKIVPRKIWKTPVIMDQEEGERTDG